MPPDVGGEAMTRVDVRVTCDKCGETIGDAQTYVTMPSSDKVAKSQADSLAMLVHRALWHAVQRGACITATSQHCHACRAS
jgi:hypothetical protein